MLNDIKNRLLPNTIEQHAMPKLTKTDAVKEIVSIENLELSEESALLQSMTHGAGIEIDNSIISAIKIKIQNGYEIDFERLADRLLDKNLGL